jgi:hypothetical protein
MAEMVECLPSKHEAFGLNTTKPSTQKKISYILPNINETLWV